jgi:hypothetical protein
MRFYTKAKYDAITKDFIKWKPPFMPRIQTYPLHGCALLQTPEDSPRFQELLRRIVRHTLTMNAQDWNREQQKAELEALESARPRDA